MRVSRLMLHGFQQFRHLDLDLTVPGSREPLEKACLIGPNGTGKSTLLRILLGRLQNLGAAGRSIEHLSRQPSLLAVRLTAAQGESAWLLSSPEDPRFIAFRDELGANAEWTSLAGRSTPAELNWQAFAHLMISGDRPAWLLLEAGLDLLIHVPPDEPQVLRNDPPATNLSQSLQLRTGIPVLHQVSLSRAEEFWRVLIHLVKNREGAYLAFLESNPKATVEQLRSEFDSEHPKILPALARLWNGILDRAGLIFDAEKAQIPTQLEDKLLAYVKLKSTGISLSYNQLSSGIRNYLFLLGHVYALYFGREVRQGFLLVDEPENSLHPDLLFDLVDRYLEVVHNTQVFMATHSPIVAAQFAPEERILLDFDDQACVTARRGVSPEGDDPNDMLIHDFAVRSIYGSEGLAKWKRFQELRDQIERSTDPTERMALMREFLSIGSAYNFDVDALPDQE